MPKADRILANLPPTFRLLGDPSALRALVDAYGGELQAAENALVAVMRAHWVEFADAGEEKITDLALFAALYGLAPRADESVEEFREHLLRYVRTQLEGTVTVPGILRTAAEALGLHLEDDLDTWWERDGSVPGSTELVTTLPVGADAASAVLGVPEAARTGRDASRARLVGDADLSLGVDLSTRSTLSVEVDDGGLRQADLTTGAADPTRVTAAEIVAALDAELGAGLASLDAGHLVLTSPTSGPTSVVHVADGPDDAADLVLGLRPRLYQGVPATRGTIVGTADLSTALDLRDTRYLRLRVDGTRLAEVDVASVAADPAAVDLADVTDAINDALGVTVASDDGRFLTLTAPTLGSAGSVQVLEAAAQDAAGRLLGQAPRLAVGVAPQRARVVSDRSIGLGVDLSAASVLRLTVDAEAPVSVDVAGLDPVATLPQEIVTSVNEGVGATVASHDGDRLTLESPTDGATGQLVVGEVEQDAAEQLLGLRARSAHGTPPVTAALTGAADLAGTVNLSARHLLVLAVDGADPVEVDLRAGAADPAHVTLEEIADAINTALGRPADDPVASDDGAHLVLVSPTEGAGGSLAVHPLVATSRRRFVTRARVTDDAATTLLGFSSRTAHGTAATVARLAGTANLSGGVNLTTTRWLRLQVGDAAALDVDVAGPRPRATTPEQVADAVNAAFEHDRPTVPRPVAITDGDTLTFTDLAPGGGSRVVVEPPQALDARVQVLGEVPGQVPADVRGRGATGVRFTGTVGLTAGASMPADGALRLGVDGAPPVDVVLGDGAGTTVLTLGQLVTRVNVALAASVAAHDGEHLVLASPTTGATSTLTIEPPSTGTDVTADVLGITPPRTYTGRAATPARISGVVDLSTGVDLTQHHLLVLEVDRDGPVTVDLTAAVAEGDRDQVAASQVAAAINAGSGAEAVTVPIPGGVAVQVTSPTTGPNSHLVLGLSGAGDAAPLLLGAAARSVSGAAPGPAVVDGDIDLLAPADLSDRSVLRLAIDGAAPVDVDVAGVVPSATTLAEVIARVDDVLPGVAQRGPQDRLRLVSPTAGTDSSVEVVTVRHLDLVEYPPTTDSASGAVRHGSVLRFTHGGAAAVPARVEVTTASGVAGPRLADPDAGWSVRIDGAVGAHERLVLEVVPGVGVRATIHGLGGARVVPPDDLHVHATDPAGVLVVRRGRNAWSWTECRAARFDVAVFDADRFAGGDCTEDAVFDLSLFGPSGLPAVFADAAERPATAQLHVTWDSHEAGSFVVNLPQELDVRFGEPFGVARLGAATPERIDGVVTEPVKDPSFIVDRIGEMSALITAGDPVFVTQVPIGWSPVTMPFREPVPFTLGTADRPARLYVADPGFGAKFLVLEAEEPGTWGNRVSLSARPAGPAIFDLEVHFTGSRFENARSVVLGPELPTLADALLVPSPLGVGRAKAAGIHADVTRDRTAGTATEEREEGTS